MALVDFVLMSYQVCQVLRVEHCFCPRFQALSILKDVKTMLYSQYFLMITYCVIFRADETIKLCGSGSCPNAYKFANNCNTEVCPTCK